MSDNKPSANFRLMIIDIAEDKIVLDEFCDCIVGGVAKKVGSSIKGSCLLAAKCGVIAGVAAVGAAEEAIELHKKKVVQNIMGKAGINNIEKFLDGLFSGENDCAEVIDDGAET